ncbi:MAG TPA: sugar phosphate isomerase/epimerase [Verrucomicrobiae bacterium]|nr:sugar phosphate isomerase/epimerase [Verrucomicrobiae bacterium]
MKIKQVAAQLYTVRDFLKTPPEIAGALKRIRAIGYQAVQLSGLGPISEEDLVALLKGEGLTCCATHEDSNMILNEPQRVVERLRKFDCPLTAYAWPAGISFDTLADVKSFAKRLNAAGKVLHDAGQVLCYHNHHIEFRRLAGKPILEILFEETDPRYLQGEPDTYWVQHGGGDPVEWCQRLRNRLPILHMKDYTVTSENKVAFAEIGNGNLDWNRIIPAAETAGCQWFCIEQDTCPGDPFDSLKQSFDFTKQHLTS